MYHFITLSLATFLITAMPGMQACSQTPKQPAPDARVMFYNVENLFDTIDDPLKDDKEFLPTAKSNWNAEKYNTKLNHITQVIGAANYPAIVGLCEVENKTVLNDLVKQQPLAAKNYAMVHFDSPDERGIDVALLYQSTVFKVMASKALNVFFEKEPEEKTRDILYVKGQLGNDVVHVFVNHWPSRREGEEATRLRRETAANVLRHSVDSILGTDTNAQIIIMGDFNDQPTNESITKTLGAKNFDAKAAPKSLYNLAGRFATQGKGTHKYKGEWGTLDQMIISTGLLDKKGFYTAPDAAMVGEFDFLLGPDPKGGQWTMRTYAGDKYLGGYSDHLPIYLDLYKK